MQALRDFWRFHFLKTLLGLVVIQLAIVAWLQVRNHRPVAIADEVHVVEGQSIKIQPLRNDTDKDEHDLDSLRVVKLGESIYGKLSQRGKYLHYEAKYGTVGVDSFLYIISDGKKESKEAYIKITINKNLEPIANIDKTQLFKGRKVKLPVLDNDTDRENDSIFIKEYTQPMHGELSKIGNDFVYSAVGVKAVVDSFHYIISDGYNTSEKVAVIIDVKDKSYAGYPWLSSDIGNVNIQGALQRTNSKLSIEASGDDIWTSRDGFHFAFQNLVGDCELVAKVESFKAEHEWAKVGVTIRESLNSGSKNVIFGYSNKNGSFFQSRTGSFQNTNGLGGTQEAKAPGWIKLVRKGNSFTAFESENGKLWNKIGDTNVDMYTEVYVGLAVTSHNNEQIAKAVFSNIRVKGKVMK